MKKILSIIFSLLIAPLMAQNSQLSKDAFDQAKKGEAILIDVREQGEVADGMIENAKWFALSKINHDKNWLSEFKNVVGNKKIYLYCRSGGRSGRVQSILKKNGIEAVNLGGYMTLQNQLPTQKK